MHAAAVDAVVPLHPDLGDVLIGRVLEVKKHPNADRLSLCRVDAGGAGGPVEVVCGAPNVQAGKTYPYAPVGATLPGGLKLERRKIRGVESNGMLCSAKELGLGEDHAGILEVDTTASPGSRFVDVVPVADHQIVIDVPANRPDLLCHKGVARELAAVLGGTVKLPPMPAPAGGSRPTAATSGVVDGVEVRLEDPEGAPRYMIAVIRGVKVAPSPRWLTGRLSSIGQRPINNVVDATNYILFELNQPLHAFDLAKVNGPAVVVRRAKPGEKIVTLDGLTRTLTPDMTTICDAKRPTIIAGVMGSADSEVSPATTDLVLECAYFQPTRSRRARRALELSSESSYRFERGIDMLGMPDALRRAIELIVAVAGGELREPPLDLWPEPQQEKTIFLRPERVAHLLGMPVELAEIERRLTAAGFFLAPKDGRLRAQGPGWRPALAAVLTGARRPSHWSEGAKLSDMDIWDLKHHFELAVDLATPGCTVEPATGGVVGWQAVERSGGAVMGWAGPLEADAPVWAAPLFGLEVRLAVTGRASVVYRPLPVQPPAERDVALVLPGGVSAAQVAAVLQRAVGPLLERFDVFDEYRGPGIPAGHRGVAWHCSFRDPERTLREEQARDSGGNGGGRAAGGSGTGGSAGAGGGVP